MNENRSTDTVRSHLRAAAAIWIRRAVSRGHSLSCADEQNHIQTIKFQIARLVVESLADVARRGNDAKARVFRLQSRHQLFPQVYAVVEEYVAKKVDFQGEHPSELRLEKYVMRIIERLRDRIEPDDSQGEAPLMPVLNLM